jgi:hypothetical protein
MLMPDRLLMENDLLLASDLALNRKQTPKDILMERTYLKAWEDFYQNTKDIPQTVKKLLEKDK